MDGTRLYAPITGSIAPGNAVLEPIEDEFVVTAYDWSRQPRPHSMSSHPSIAEAMTETKRRYGDDLHSWWVIPPDVPDAVEYAFGHSGAPSGERQRYEPPA